MDSTNHLVIMFLSIDFTGSKLIYWTGRFIKTGKFEIKLEPNKPYMHEFEGIRIRSDDQKTFYIEM